MTPKSPIFKFISKNYLILLFSLIFGSAWGYTFVIRLADFFRQTVIRKMNLLIPAALVGTFIAYWFLRWWWSRFVRLRPVFKGLVVVAALALSVGLYNYLPYQLPTFYTLHTLRVEVVNTPTPDVPCPATEIRSLLLPSGEQVPVEQIKTSGDDWTVEGTAMVSCKNGASIEYQGEFFGGMKVCPRRSTKSGAIKIWWDGYTRQETLSNPDASKGCIELDNNTWGEPQGIWQVMAVAMVGADMICILSVAMLALLLAIL